VSTWRRAALAAWAVTMSMTLIGAADPAAARTCTIPGLSGNDPAAESLMDLTVKASRSGGYAGTVWVEIHGQGGTRSEALRVVHADAGHLAIEAPDPPGPAMGTLLVQAGKSRSVVRVGAGSVNRGQTALVDEIEPDSNLQQMLGKYRVLLEGGVRVLQRDAKVVRIERIADHRTVERWTIDATSGLLLKRDSYNATGTVERSIAFTEVRQPYVPTVEDLHPPTQPDPSSAAPQRWFSAGELSRQAKALGMPAILPAGYRLESGTTFKAGAASAVQLVYTDGLEDVSLFAQPGSMIRSGLPASARNVALSKVNGLRWEGFPRGLAWQDGPSTLTLVGAAPTDELTQMANALPQAPLRRSLRQRLGHLVDWMKQRLP
jgi:negative regulator of sigma E activity